MGRGKSVGIRPGRGSGTGIFRGPIVAALPTAPSGRELSVRSETRAKVISCAFPHSLTQDGPSVPDFRVTAHQPPFTPYWWVTPGVCPMSHGCANKGQSDPARQQRDARRATHGGTSRNARSCA